MYGAILGDMIGSPYEWHNTKSKDFPLFSRHSRFTDDTVMTLAVADGIMNVFRNKNIHINGPDDISGENKHIVEESVIRSMKELGNRYPHAGYGGSFRKWLKHGSEPYNSWGNGSAMRVSSVAWIFDDIDTVREMAALQAAVTHNHPEGIKGAEALASAIFMARSSCRKEEIREYIANEFGYDLARTCDEIRPDYEFDVSCQGSVPEAIIAFIEGTDFEDVVRNAISLGGDSDTIGAMAGSIAEAYYGVPEELKEKCEEMLPFDLRSILQEFADEYMEGADMNRNNKDYDTQFRCPYCGSTNTARILYGMPIMDEELDRKIREGKVVIGGCLVNIEEIDGQKVISNPDRKCNDCGKEFSS